MNAVAVTGAPGAQLSVTLATRDGLLLLALFALSPPVAAALSTWQSSFTAMAWPPAAPASRSIS